MPLYGSMSHSRILILLQAALCVQWVTVLGSSTGVLNGFVGFLGFFFVIWVLLTVFSVPVLQWCRRGQCVQYGDHGPKPVHGQWSAWSGWSECTRTCGGGVTYQERHCNNPK